MKLRSKPVGELVRLVDNRNLDNEISNLIGLNIKKEFIPSIANITDTDLSKYKIISKNQFCYSPMQTGRDETIRVALYTNDRQAIISPAYSVFEVINTSEVLPEYIMIYFLRPESDRFGWFISDSSVRASLDWDRFCEITLPLPSVEVQKKYVDIYQSLTKNQKIYEHGLQSLKSICNSFIDNQISTGDRKKLGDYIEEIHTKNTNSENRNVLGISIKKEFMPSKANRDDLDVSNYKLLEKRQFGFVSVTSRNGEKISIAILEGPPGIISSTYVAFRVKDYKKLLPEYLYLWFNRNEFDRYARYHSWGSARETFDWADMCNVELPIPNIDEQRSIVAIHKILEERKEINKKLKMMVQPLCPVLIQGAEQEQIQTK